MAIGGRVKRRLLREAVEENVAIINGHSPRRVRNRRAAARRWAFRLAILAAPLVVFGMAVLAGVLAGQGPAWWPSGPGWWRALLSRHTGATSSEPAPPGVRGDLVGAATRSLDPNARYPRPEPLDPKALPLGVRRIVLDPGHGGNDHGTIGPLGLVEKDLALDIVQRLRPMLEMQSYGVVMTRETDASIPLDQRAQLANAARGDVFVSVHVNWIPNRSARGVETYFLGPTDDPYLTALAAAENRNSGYSLADFRRLLDGIYADLRQGESRTLAANLQGKLYRSLAASNAALQDRGVKRAPFIVLVATEMPAVLVEVSCLSNDEEARLLATSGYRQKIAHALFAGIVTYARNRNHEPEKGI